jgi:hypothetical protein
MGSARLADLAMPLGSAWSADSSLILLRWLDLPVEAVNIS